MEQEAGVLPRQRPPPLGTARGTGARVGIHAALCSFTGGVAGGGSRGSQAGAAALPAGAGRAVLPRARRRPGLARIPPSSSRPPSSSPLGPQPRSTSLIFSKLPRPGPFVPLVRGDGCEEEFATPGRSTVTMVVGGDRDPGLQPCTVPSPICKEEGPGGARIIKDQSSADCWFCTGLCSP